MGGSAGVERSASPTLAKPPEIRVILRYVEACDAIASVMAVFSQLVAAVRGREPASTDATTIFRSVAIDEGQV